MTDTASAFASLSRNRSAVLGVAFLVMVLAGSLGWLAIGAMSREASAINLLPIRAVTFAGATGELKRVDIGELKRIAGAIENMGGSMLRTDLNDVKAAVRQVEWVRDAEVRRRFPAMLEVRIEEHVAAARWQYAGEAEHGLLVNTHGEVFEADLDESSASLPALSGPRESAREMLANYQAFNTQLAAVGLRAAEIRLSPRRAWQVRLENGSVLELGRNDADLRLGRYVRAHAGIAAVRAANTRIDMRYPNGFAVRVALAKPAAESAAGKPARKATGKS